MKATAFEFRFRFLIHVVLYVLGFIAPWDRLLHSDAGRSVWVVLAASLARTQWLTFDAATITLLVLAMLCAIVAAILRTWGSAYLGASIVAAHSMQGHSMVAAGPYRYLRNPLYLGTFIHTLALALLMPPGGAIFALFTIGLFQLRLIVGEEAFLLANFGEPYLAYCAQVPRLLPTLAPHVASPPTQPEWVAALLGEIYMWGVAAAFAFAGWRYNALLIARGAIISLGLSLIARAFLPKR